MLLEGSQQNKKSVNSHVNNHNSVDQKWKMQKELELLVHLQLKEKLDPYWEL